MKRKIRILRIWRKGKLSLAESIHWRIYRELLYEAVTKFLDCDYRGIAPQEFQDEINKAQLEYYKSLNNQR